MNKNILLKIQYDGTNYSGWQSQNNAIAIQDTVEAALSVLHKGEKVQIIGCSRTDAGVHAINYTANFKTNCRIPSDKMHFALNAHLNDDIRVLSAEDTDDTFHARYSAIKKTYSYKILKIVFIDVIFV